MHHPQPKKRRILLFANTAWYLFNFRLDLANKLRDEGFDVIMLAPYDEYVAKLSSMGFEVHTVRMNRKGTNPFEECLLLIRVLRVLRKTRPDVVFNFTLKCVLSGGLAAMLSGIKSRVHAVAGLGSIYSKAGAKYAVLRLIVSRVLRIALRGKQSRLIVQNRDDYRVFIDNGLIDGGHVALIKGSGVCGSRFQAFERNQKSDTLNILFAARLLRAKGIEDFVALAKHYEPNPRVRFLIAGSPDQGNQDSVSEQELQQWSNRPNIHLLGHVENMHELLRDTDVVCLPSQYGEGVPRILVEAAASSLPLVGYDVPGTREIIEHNRNGFLCAAGDTQALYESIGQLVNSPETRARMGLASRELFQTVYEARSVNQRTLKVILETLDADKAAQWVLE